MEAVDPGHSRSLEEAPKAAQLSLIPSPDRPTVHERRSNPRGLSHSVPR